MITKKKPYKTVPTCEVVFELPADIEAKSASLVGDFNDWDVNGTPMKKVKGVWKASLKLQQGQEYQFRYLVNGEEWHNDDDADKYVPNNIDGDNSVVSVPSR